MKFIHTADLHLDSPAVTLAEIPNATSARRIEQRMVMKEMVEYIIRNNIPYFFICGDLYEQEYIRQSTIEYINGLFKMIPDTKIFIIPGNHDPYINNSFYKTFKWSSNVHIFTSKLEKVECDNVDIYGYGFNDFYMNNNYPQIEVQNVDRINILLTHGDLDTSENEVRKYNPMSSRSLKDSKFDYIGLGHIHKKSFEDYDGQKIVYPGSPISMGFDELGERGFIVGNIDDESKKLSLEFVKTSAKTFEEYYLDMTNANLEEDLVQIINNIKFDNNKYYKIILTGKHNFEVDTKKILALLNLQNVIKIKDESKTNYDISEIAKQVSLKGILAKNILNKLKMANTDEEKEELLQAFEVGMDAFNK